LILEIAEKIGKHFLYPSTIWVSAEPYEIITILGSCVAVCLYDQKFSIGGINHYMLPLWNGSGLASPKYGNIAIEKLFEKLIFYGCKTENITAKIFGGAEIIEKKTMNYNIGAQNIEIALEILHDKRIPIVSSSLGGKSGRKIIFNTSTGEVRQFYIIRS
jgi:chemotaxis protein CheD